MYRVMLIDDEKSARNLLKASLDWDKVNMEVVGEASSGIEAINIIDDIKPDLAFVDISMPFMNGIEFTKLATDRYPDLIIIIMTALDDFEYARACVRLPVLDYMLKPIVRTEVMETLKRAQAMLDEKKKEQNQEETVGEISNSAMDEIKKFIEENYKDSQLNLASVAMQFGFNPSYLSRKFKHENGKNFVEYLTEYRMEKATALAKSGAKMFMAAKEVGIPDPNYFGRCFKKYTGISYSEYK